MSRALPRKFKVVNKQFITQNMLRVTLQQTDNNPLPANQDGGYIKLHFPRPGVLNNDIEKQILSEDTQCRPLLRTYTICQQRSDLNEIDIDFVVHEIGPASQWALSCVTSDVMYIAGPGKIKFIDPTADWFLILGDMTALPAISANLARLPADAKGYGVVEVVSEDDIQALRVPDGFELIWLVNTQLHNTSALLHKIKNLPLLEGTPSVWSACEFDAIANLRDHFYKTLSISKRDVYASSYWKRGLNEEQHREAKRAALNN